MDRLMRKLGAEQATRQTAGLGSFFKKMPAADAENELDTDVQPVPSSPAKDPNPAEQEPDAEAPQQSEDGNGTSEAGEQHLQAEAASPAQGLEPSGTSELSQPAAGDVTEDDSEDEAAPLKRISRVRRASEDSDSGTKEESEKDNSAQHRRIRVVADDDEEEYGEKDVAMDEETVAKKYLEDVKVVDEGAETDDADDAPTREEDSDEGMDDDGDTQKIVRLEDFDDEEEFLLAGGDVQEAKKRKEWGLHHSEDEQEEEEVVEKKDKLSEKEEIRKIYRESERILREKRCMIPPSQAPRLTFSTLFAKVDQKSKELKPDPADQKVMVSPQPGAPEDEGAAAGEGPSGLTLEDEDDEFVVVFEGEPTNAPAATAVAPAAAAAAAAAPVAAAKTEEARRGGAERATPFSPPGATKKRGELRSKLRQSAFARSEHVTVKPAQEPAGAGAEGAAAASGGAPFVAAEGFVGSRAGYVFQLGPQGLGYYADGGPHKVGSGGAAGEEAAMVGVADGFQLPVTDSQEVDTSMHDTQLECAAEDDGAQGGADARASRKLDLRYEDDETQAPRGDVAVGPAKPSIFSSFIGVDEGTAVMHGGGEAADAPVGAAGAGVGASGGGNASLPAPRRAYGRRALEREAGKSTLPEESENGEDKEEEEGKMEEFSWREPTLDEDVGGEADDEDGSEEEEDEESDDDDDEEEDDSDDEEEEEEAKEPEKKTLNDVVSIKKQSALRLGTLEAGYLRNEHEAMGISEEIGVAKEDLEEGIDLMDTDGEDNDEEQEDDSEEERQVAEGFIEDAKFAVQDMDPEAYKQFHQQMQEDDEQRMTDRILDVVRGEARRRKVQGGEEWIPNRNARQRVLNQMHGAVDENGFAISDMAASVEDAATNEEVAAQIAAAHAKEKADRIRFQQQRRLEEEARRRDGCGDGDDDGDAPADEQPRPAAPTMRRGASFCGPQLAAFTRQMSFSAQGGGGAGKAGEMQRSGSMAGRRPGTSLLGSAPAGAGAQGEGKENKNRIVSSRNFFFDKKQRGDAEAPQHDADSQGPDADLAAVPMKRGPSTSGVPFARKLQRTTTAPPLKRSTSNLIKTLDGL